MEQGLITVSPELLNLGVGALSLIVMFALIRLISDITKSNRERDTRNDETENLQAKTNLKLVENQTQLSSMFEKIEASIAFNASATQRQTATLDDIKADNRRQVEALADIKNTFSAANVASAVHVAQQPTSIQLIQEHNEILKVTRDSQQLITDQIKAIGVVAEKFEALPTVEQAKDILSKLTKVETEIISMRTEVVLLLTKLMQPVMAPEPPKTETSLSLPVDTPLLGGAA